MTRSRRGVTWNRRAVTGNRSGQHHLMGEWEGERGMQLPNSTDASVAVGAYPTFLGGDTAPVVQAYYATKCGPLEVPGPPAFTALCV